MYLMPLFLPSFFLQIIKDDLESHQRQVSACADQAKQLLLSGSDVLAPHEVR